ncbi:MAG: 2-oxoglutarate dehydrogenase E1 component [Pseudomonadales bacterium]|nr:2-oxoglutarate dehydrogenase E1 component [Pseudomonadales bacterium]
MHDTSMRQMWQSAHMQGNNLAYVESLYEAYLLDPQSISQEWRDYFDALPAINDSTEPEPSYAAIEKQFTEIGKQSRTVSSAITDSVSIEHEKKQVRVLSMIHAYRFRGHQKASLDPLGLMEREEVPDLNLAFHDLSSEDLHTGFRLGSLFFGPNVAPLHDIVRDLEKTYCSHIGFEYMHAVDTRVKRWFQQRIEPVRGQPQYSHEVKKDILLSLTAAEGLEKYLGARYPGTKRFGIEGGESLIPMIEEMINRSAAYGAQEIVIGMAHRGRLNVLVNILGKKPAELFEEFEGKSKINGSGDVKYHQGFSSNWISPSGEVHLALSFNPSHLEVVSPVVEGSVRARQDRREDTDKIAVVPIVIHGDAAFAGQGVVMEVFQMSQTRGYYTGGTIHIILNNQVGFTTSRREDARSTEYCTDVAKMIEAPIIHVNGDNPEAVIFATQLAMDYRNEFKKDVVIDLICYRRRGHNEADEPSATQPLMYKVIKKHPTTRELYAERLVKEGVVSIKESEAIMDQYRNALDAGGHLVEHWVNEPNFAKFVDWTPYLNKEWTARHDTRVDIDRLRALGKLINTVPEQIKVQRQVAKIYKDRMQMVEGELFIDWGCAEALAYATLINSGHPVRLTGQDVGRGTFSHRHAVLHSQSDGAVYIPLQNIAKDQPVFDIYDSLLSEMAVLGFEYGYSTTSPKSLVIWEAQFGDFANNAQVVIDQFITSGEHKWSRLCGLTMFLPHGYEGQGPEHSSARLERFLQLSAEHNIQVCLPTTPAQVFHMLRRQIIRPLRKPLIVMTAKSLLRHKQVISSMEELADGTFHTILPETENHNPEKIKRVILCSGKIYYELLNQRQENGPDNLAILRIEQIYPFPEDDLAEALSIYPNLNELTWVQEEPLNQGVWYNCNHHMRNVIDMLKNDVELTKVAREASASPAVGHMELHQQQQQKVITDALRSN